MTISSKLAKIGIILIFGLIAVGFIAVNLKQRSRSVNLPSQSSDADTDSLVYFGIEDPTIIDNNPYYEIVMGFLELVGIQPATNTNPAIDSADLTFRYNITPEVTKDLTIRTSMPLLDDNDNPVFPRNFPDVLTVGNIYTISFRYLVLESDIIDEDLQTICDNTEYLAGNDCVERFGDFGYLEYTHDDMEGPLFDTSEPEMLLDYGDVWLWSVRE